MEQKHNENAIVIFQGGKQMNLFNEIEERILQCDDIENRITQKDFQKKHETENEGCDEMMETFHMEIEFLERWINELEGGMKLATPNREEIVELSKCFNSSINIVVVCTEDNIDKYEAKIRGIMQKIFNIREKTEIIFQLALLIEMF